MASAVGALRRGRAALHADEEAAADAPEAWGEEKAHASATPTASLWQRLSALEKYHIVVFLMGILTFSGFVPEWLCLTIYAGQLILVVGWADKRAFFRKEQYYIVGFAREVALVLAVIYVDNVSLYMVSVYHKYRMQNIFLQDNGRLMLEFVFRQSIFVKAVFDVLPELCAREVVMHCCMLAVLCTLRPTPISLLAAAAKFVRTLWAARLFRCICFVSVVMPSQRAGCFINRFDTTYNEDEHWREALLHWRAGGGCNDLVYSGHGVVITLCGLLYRDYSEILGASPRLVTFIWLRVGHAFMRIIHDRMHMSVDLVVAAIMTVLIYLKVPGPRDDPCAFFCVGVGGAKVALEEDPSELRASTDDGERATGEEDCYRVAARRTGRSLPGFRQLLCTPAAILWISALLVVVAWALFVAAAGSANMAGPLSKYNRKRLQVIAPVSAAELAPAGRPRPRLLCVMLHLEVASWARQGYADAARETWGSHCDGLLLWDEQSSEGAAFNAEVAKLEPTRQGSSPDRWLRVRRLWRHIAKVHLDHFDWFVEVDDGGFVVAENVVLLARMLEEESVDSRAEETQDESAGEGRGAMEKPVFLPLMSQSRNSGSNGGFLMNRAAARELLAAMDRGTNACPKPSETAKRHDEYSVVPSCLGSRWVRPLGWPISPSINRALGCEEGKRPIVNLKTGNDGGTRAVCEHSILAFMVPQPAWNYDIHDIIYRRRTPAEGSSTTLPNEIRP